MVTKEYKHGEIRQMNLMNANENRVLTNEERESIIEKLIPQFKDILETMGFDVDNDQQLKDTPKRISKMYVNELFSGCYEKAPKVTVFNNENEYDEMVFLGPIQVKSTCSHHFVGFIGSAYIAYIPDKKVVGISKLARIVKWYMRRPQIQEELTKQISDYLEKTLQPKGVAVYIKAQHLCMISRGVEEHDSWMKTSSVKGIFMSDTATRSEFFNLINAG